MRSVPFLAALGAALFMQAMPAAQAMGFGRAATATTLGQRLDFSAAITLDADEPLPRECVAAEVHVGDALLPAPAVRVTLEPAGDGSSGQRVRVTTSTLIDEPVVTVEVSVGCNSRMSRRFVTFIDPPLVRLAEAAEPLRPQAGRESQVSAILGAARDGAKRGGSAGRRAATDLEAEAPRPRVAARQARHRLAANAGGARRAAAVPAGDPPARTASLRKGSAAPGAMAAVRGAPRLQLEPPTVAAGTAPRAAAGPAPALVAAAPAAASPPLIAPSPAPVLSPTATAPELAVAAAAAALAPNDPDAAALARERERIQILEAGLAGLRADAQATQQSLVTLQARLREAESSRYANGLVYALSAGLAFFAALSVVFWLIRPRQRRRARWFDAAANQQARAARNPSKEVRPAVPERDSQSLELQDTPSWSGGPGVLNTTPATIGGLEVTTVLGPASARPGAGSTAANSALAGAAPAGSRRSASTSMETLIDLEQQAEFYIVLGQDEAAIALLEAHVREDSGSSALPCLKLLEIHQRRGDRAAYEAVRLVFRDHFETEAPEWDADLRYGRAIDDYPQTVARLQALWATPLQAMQALEGMLFRRAEPGDAFDFPAYRELLFLYGVARELAGHVDTDLGSIDLFLPLDEAAAPAAQETAGHEFSVDLDITGWATGAPADNLVVRRAPVRKGRG